MNKYTINCTEEQTRKALELGAPIEFEQTIVHDWSTGKPVPYPDIATDEDGEPVLIKSTAEQMIGWLRAKGFKFILSDDIDCNEGNNWWIGINGELITQGCNENKELAAIDAALEYLTKNKK